MLFPNKSTPHTVRETAAPTSSYVAGTVFSMDEHNYLGVLVKYTKGDETNIKIKIESSVDGGTTYGQQVTQNASGGNVDVDLAVYTFDVTGNYWITVSPMKADTVKISVLATAGTPTGTVGIDAITAWV